MRENSTVKEACVVEVSVESLNELLKQLEVCEQELTAYLDFNNNFSRI